MDKLIPEDMHRRIEAWCDARGLPKDYEYERILCDLMVEHDALLAACELTLSWLPDTAKNCRETVSAAIAKAKGEST